LLQARSKFVGETSVLRYDQYPVRRPIYSEYKALQSLESGKLDSATVDRQQRSTAGKWLMVARSSWFMWCWLSCSWTIQQVF